MSMSLLLIFLIFISAAGVQGGGDDDFNLDMIEIRERNSHTAIIASSKDPRAATKEPKANKFSTKAEKSPKASIVGKNAKAVKGAKGPGAPGNKQMKSKQTKSSKGGKTKAPKSVKSKKEKKTNAPTPPPVPTPVAPPVTTAPIPTPVATPKPVPKPPTDDDDPPSKPPTDDDDPPSKPPTDDDDPPSKPPTDDDDPPSKPPTDDDDPPPVPVATPKPVPAPVTTPQPIPATPTSPPFANPGVTLSTSKMDYNLGEPIVVNVVNSSPMLFDWVSIFNCNPLAQELSFQYTGGVSPASITFEQGSNNWPFPSNCYYAKYFNGNELQTAQSTFNILTTPNPPTPPTMSPPTNPPTFVSGAGISTNKFTYTQSEQITVKYSNNQPTAADGIGIYHCTTEAELGYIETNGASSGTITFGPFPAACYFAEYYNSAEVLIALADFYVT